MAWDMSHLTPFGSKFVVDRILGAHLGELRGDDATDSRSLPARNPPR